MARETRRKVKQGPGGMNTYGDMVTLLLTFILFSMSTVDIAKFRAFINRWKVLLNIAEV